MKSFAARLESFERLAEALPDRVISIDTYKPEVARKPSPPVRESSTT